MNCNCGKQCPQDKCLSSLTFCIEDGFLVPRLSGVPLEPVDLRDIAKNSETNTYLQLDAGNERLIFYNENSEKGSGSPDMIPIEAISRLISIADLSDVQYSVATNGDILSWDGDNWVSYTVPSGTIVSPVGVDADGKIVKQGSSDPLPVPGEIPIGGIMIWPALPNQAPSGWLECNGQAVSRSVYSDLFAIIGTRYGSGDGTTSFNLPNMQTRNVAGLSSIGTIDTQFQDVGQTGGSKTHTLSAAEMPTHNHTGSTNSAGNHSHSVNSGGAEIVITAAGTGTWLSSGGNQQVRFTGLGTNAAGNHSHSFTTGNRGSSQPHNNLAPYITMPYIMRAL